MDLYFLNKDKIAKFQREGIKYDPKVPKYLQEFTSLQVKRQNPTEDQNSKKEWINTVTSDEFKREFFNHSARISVCSFKPKHKDEEYIPSEYSLSSDGKKQTKYKAVVIAVLIISSLVVLAVSGAIVFIFRYSSQNNENLSVTTSNSEPTESSSTLSILFSITTLKITKNTTSKTKSSNPSTTDNLASATAIAKTEASLTAATTEDSPITTAFYKTAESMTTILLSSFTSEPITTDKSFSATGSSGLPATSNDSKTSDGISTSLTTFQTPILTTVVGTTSINNTNTMSSSTTETSSLTIKTTTTTALSNSTTESNDTSSAAVITDISNKTISSTSKETSTSTQTTVPSITFIVPTQKTLVGITQSTVKTTIQTPLPDRQETPKLMRTHVLNTGQATTTETTTI